MNLEEELEIVLEKGVKRSADDMIKSVEAAYGEIPYVFSFMKEHPELLVTKMLHNNAILRSSSLDERTVELISVAVSAALRCSHCLRLHIRVASNLGIPDDQIAEAIFLAGNLVNASVLATATRGLDEERDICRVCEIDRDACEIHRPKKG
ncbi:MAG: carboxymuconolactone decarboxylase family protein [Methanothrix sp.]|nr:carboxymuconolactone decarboxylase family protein [Methanothrix sp.]